LSVRLRRNAELLRNPPRPLSPRRLILLGIEKVDEEIRQGKASRAAIDQNDRNKDAVMQSIRNLRAGIVSLEVDFKSKEHLRIYSGSISGITQMMGVAEDQVGEGRVRDAGRTLLSISERLVDTIAAIP